MRIISTIVLVVYLLVGVVIANNHHYFANTHGVNGIVSAALAVLLWPLILLGVNLHIGGSGGGKGVLVPLPAIGARLAGRRRERT
ncbi:MAG: hypothetical protein ACXVQU_07430 [Actinomycetota bacterium]|jgi:hypothetical protein